MSDQTSKPSYRLSIRRPVTMAMLFLSIIVFGWKSYQELPINLMPDISYPTLTVRTEYEGGRHDRRLQKIADFEANGQLST